MNGWLVDTHLLKQLASPSRALQRWCEANDPELFLSCVSIAEMALAIEKMPASQPMRASAMRDWLNGIVSRFGDRIHAADPELCARAGALMPRLTHAYPRFRMHDALLVATAQARGHGLLTRRDGVFGPWTRTPIAWI
jgi:predicted nucleic acid-binding protein